MEQIKQKIQQLEAGTFQNLCDSILCKEGYENIRCLGSQGGTQKKRSVWNMIDFSDFIEILPRKYVREKYIAVKANNMLALSKELRSELTDKQFILSFSRDCKSIVIKNCSDGKLHFDGNGYVKCNNLLPFFTEQKIQIPCKYSVIWDDDSKVWVGTYSGDYIQRAPRNNQLPSNKKISSKPRKRKAKGMEIEKL